MIIPKSNRQAALDWWDKKFGKKTSPDVNEESKKLQRSRAA